LTPASAEKGRIMRLSAVVVIIAIMITASALTYTALAPPTIKTTTEVSTSTLLQTTTSTLTESQGSTTYYNPPQNGQRVSVLNSIWNFTASVNSIEVSQAQAIFVEANITNISSVAQTTNELVQPWFNVSLYASNGSLLWTFGPQQPASTNYTIASGHSFGQSTSVPTSGLPIGQSYTIRVNPPSFPTASNMTIAMRFTLTSGSALPPSNVVFLMSVNGTWYWADNISNDIVVGAPGYSYFLNSSVILDGVKFQTICPSIYRDCPGSNSSSTVVMAGAIRFNMSFPDGANETVGGVIGDSNILYVFSQHSTPRAGMLIEYVNDYGYPHYDNGRAYAVFLLGSSCGGPPHLC